MTLRGGCWPELMVSPVGWSVQGGLLGRWPSTRSPLGVTGARAGRQSRAQHPAAPPARGGRGKELTAGALGLRVHGEAPGPRPARLGPDGRRPGAPAGGRR